MPARKPRPNRTTLRRLASAIADNAAATHALVELVDATATTVLSSIPPATNHVAADRLMWLLDCLDTSATIGRRMAHQLCAMVAPVPPAKGGQ